MKNLKAVLPKACILFFIFTLVCGAGYTAAVTGAARLLFPRQADGSIIEVNGKKYGCALLGQQYRDPAHMWGRIMHVDVSAYKDSQGKTLMYAAPSNLSPAGEEFERLVQERVEELHALDPQNRDVPIPEDLVTCSGSGLDPHISPAAAAYQTARLARENNMTKEEITSIIAQCTEGRLLGLFGEKTVNVLKVNLMLDGILK